MQVTSTSVEQTLALGELLGRLAPPNTVIALHGQLGAGKTHFTRGLAQGAAITDPTLVSSPTYVLLNIYPGPKPVFHLDAYRIASEEDFAVVGFDELLEANGLTVIEWPERIPHLLPPDYLHIHIDPGEEINERLLTIEGTADSSKNLVARLAKAWQSFSP